MTTEQKIKLAKLHGTEKQIKWAESIRAKVLAFVLDNREAIAEQIRKTIDAELAANIANTRWRKSEEERIKYATKHAERQTKNRTIENIVKRICEAPSAKMWIEKYRNGVKTVEEAAKNLILDHAFTLPLTLEKALEMERERENDVVYRMECLKERLRSPMPCYCR